MFDPPQSVPYNNVTLANVTSPDNLALAAEAAAAGLVLLKNDGVLPVSVSALTRVAVIGPHAANKTLMVGNYPGCSPGPNDPLNFTLPGCDIQSPYDAMCKAFNGTQVKVVTAPGCTVNVNDSSGIPAAVAAAAGADLIVLTVGLDTCQVGQFCSEGEANDRLGSLDLPGAQPALVAAITNAYPTTPIVVVLINGGPLSSPWLFADARVRGILEAWYGGVHAGTAIVSALFGAASPAGRMPITVVTDMAELPSYADYTMSTPPGRTHRYYTGAALSPLGYGLSYGNVTYSAVSVQPAAVSSRNASTRVTVSFTLTNVGKRTTDEVAQLYATYNGPAPGGLASVPLETLITFARVPALSAGGGAGVPISLQFQVADLALMDAVGTVRPLPGQYTLFVGGVSPRCAASLIATAGWTGVACPPVIALNFTLTP